LLVPFAAGRGEATIAGTELANRSSAVCETRANELSGLGARGRNRCERSEQKGGSRLVGPSCERRERLAQADVAQLAERVLGKDEVTGSIPVIGSNLRSRMQAKVARRSAKREGGLVAEMTESYGWQAIRLALRSFDVVQDRPELKSKDGPRSWQARLSAEANALSERSESQGSRDGAQILRA
jgi:hypothetical protein